MDKQYNHHISEPAIQKKWQEDNTYAFEQYAGTFFSIDTPPPTVSGTLHIGHIFSYTHTDIIARYKRFSGFQVFYPMGFDDNGLATERFVEKKHQINPYALGRSAFIKLCQEESEKMRLEFMQLWQRLGLSVDWNLSYSTISAPVRKISQESFIRLYNEGFAYRKHEPALYCTTCQTSVAQAELEDVEQQSFFNTIAFKTKNGRPMLIGTTRPELLPSCVAVFYHPSDQRYKMLNGMTAIVPIFDIEVPIIADEMVDPEKGTGLVMCCAFGDKTDLYWIKKYDFPYKLAIGTDGRWLAHTGVLAGLKSAQARKTILDALKNENHLIEQKAITHTVNVHERCKKEIEYIAIWQWYLRVLDKKDELIQLADSIKWYPPFMKSRYVNWVQNLTWDWCLSRQRFYGIPFPVWHCKTCGQILLASFDMLPVDPQETEYPGKICPECSSSEIVPEKDVMDTWNTSSLTPYICYHLYNPKSESPFISSFINDFLPMSMRPQAHDIIRTWAFYTMVKTWLHNKQIPWHSIVISGHVLTESKEKLSKSKEQKRLEPEHLIETYSADVIRYWTASATLGYDVQFSETQLKIGQKLVTKLWNAFRFIQEHCQKGVAQPKIISSVNQWLLHRATECYQRYAVYLDTYELSLALDAVEQFFWHDFCDNYIELIKHQLFQSEKYHQDELDSTRWTLYHVGLRILQLYAPYLPYITEVIYQELYQSYERHASINQTLFSRVQHFYEFEESVKKINYLLAIVSITRKLKTEQQLSLKAPLYELIIFVPTKDIENLLRDLHQMILGITQAENISWRIAAPAKHAITQTDQGLKAEIAIENYDKD